MEIRNSALKARGAAIRTSCSMQFEVDPWVETVELSDSCGWLLKTGQQQGRERSYGRPVKRTWALLESNLRRNNRLKTHRNDGRWGGWTFVQLPLVYRIDRSSHAL